MYRKKKREETCPRKEKKKKTEEGEDRRRQKKKKKKKKKTKEETYRQAETSTLYTTDLQKPGKLLRIAGYNPLHRLSPVVVPTSP